MLRGHRQEVWRLALLPDDKTLVSGCKDGTVCFWDTSVKHPHQPRITFPKENIFDGCSASDGCSFLILDLQGQLAQWSGVDYQQKTPLLDIGTNVYSDCFSPDGRFLALAWTNGIIQVWDLSQRVLLHQLTNSPGKVQLQTFLADGKKLLTLSESDHLFHEWDLATGLEIQSWPPPVALNLVALTPDERSCMYLGGDGDVVFRNLADQSQTKPNLDILEPSGVSYSPDGKLFAGSSFLGYARVWDSATWREKVTLRGFIVAVKTVAFSPDGTAAGNRQRRQGSSETLGHRKLAGCVHPGRSG